MSQVSTVSSSSVRRVLTKKQLRIARMSGMLEASICGIPCLIEVDTCNVVAGSYNYNAASDVDYYGYSEVEFSVYDRKGYAAAWLEKKMTDKDRQEIETLILESREGDDDGDYDRYDD